MTLTRESDLAPEAQEGSAQIKSGSGEEIACRPLNLEVRTFMIRYQILAIGFRRTQMVVK